MPKVSDYELEHLDDEIVFEKVRKKKGEIKQEKHPKKKNHREQYVD